ncbi:ABC transporter ATP-binding protein [Flagellimonas zhangzhouensis]|uniref:ABC-2 type transport system ATP-binding protein n=1 Tax=Flagellimonas zhangzhouensis TaxID=1073328 RepID=A0A1H2T058_9FLAO|nr:ABC transporter ATP-binding protein [Allomuricauda zhangzhouensis]SDQ82062.1 ABC-2 type transport system ATP-binding protein [Allomuricauda zhangzhouensis]SDW37333.1 ABC-2 type transport system ATP-binding protein [Allomuricauda zhangzhouensis]
MLKATQLSKTYKSGKALDNASIHLNSGQISGLLGRNGAGKTTLFKILCGLITPDAGKVSIASKKQKPIGAVIEEPGLYTYLNAYDNLKVFSQIQGAPTDITTLENCLKEVGLPLNRKDPVRNFSMGMKQRLGIAIALLNNPDILILDEPFSGLDPTGVASLSKLIKQLANRKIAILLSSHLMAELHKVCDDLYIIDNGKIINQGLTQDIIDSQVTIYTITGKNIENSDFIQSYIVQKEKNKVTIKCDSEAISEILKSLLDDRFKVTSCVPNITLEQLLNPVSK